MQTFNIYCDESCHLEHDRQPVMALGALWCPLEKTREIAARLREIKAQHELPSHFEMKWSKVSRGKQEFYLQILDYFLDDDDLRFRCWIAHKSELRHREFAQTHDVWYYKMMFGLLEPLLTPRARFRIYLDKKDTQSAVKVRKLHDVLCNSKYDFDRDIVERVQVVESHAVEQLQLADLLTGALSYVHRNLSGNVAKDSFIARLRQRTGYSLTWSTLLREPKVNLFVWKGRPIGGSPE